MVKALVWAKSAGKATAGEVISVIPDGMEFSASDKACDYAYVLNLPNTLLEKARQMLERYYRAAIKGDDEFEATDDADKFVKLGQRRWRFKVEEMAGISTDTEFNVPGYNVDPSLENKLADGNFSQKTDFRKGG